MKKSVNYDYERAKAKYREFCRTEPSLGIYMQDWFFDAVITENQEWRVVLVERGNEVVAAFPFAYEKRKGLWFISNPWQCSKAGIWIRNNQYKSSLDKVLREKEIIDEVVENLPYFDSFSVCFSESFGNWHPLYWNGFSETLLFSQVIQCGAEEYENVIGKNRKRKIDRARKKYAVETNQISPQTYWEFMQNCFKERGMDVHYSRGQFLKLLDALISNHACEINSVSDENGDLQGACVILNGTNRAYLQFLCQKGNGGLDEESLAIYDGIVSMLKAGKTFDFEGSMIPGICEFYASFNPEWEPYHLITKYSRRYKILNSGREIFRNLCRK